jgi:alpha-L-rhamnosidase
MVKKLMKRHFILAIISLILLQSIQAQRNQPKVFVDNLQCERLHNPSGIDVKLPRFSWQIISKENDTRQLTYQILVASSLEKLEKEEGDVWNSGQVNSSSSILVPYAGKPLASRNNYFWKVKIFTNKGEAPWSEPVSWSMGLLNKTDWKAKWIGYDKASSWDSITQWSRLSARYFRKQFQSSGAIKRATVYMTGLGLYEFYINGKKTSGQFIGPAPTDYRKSVLYNTYDVTVDVKTGNNVIATVVGNGRYFTMRQNYKPKKINTFGYPKMLLQLEIEYSNGTKKIIVSDESWKLNVDGPIRSNNEYDGEEYDATKELSGWNAENYDDSKWLRPQLVKSPVGKLVAQMIAPMKIMDTIQPVSIKNITLSGSPDKYILDMGQNFSGWVKMKVQGKRGDKVKLRFAESLQTDGQLYVANLRDARVTDIYTLKGGEAETWQPTFVYHGFRYAEITGYPGIPTLHDFEGHLMYDDMETIGSFSCSDSTINKIYRNAAWGIASNYKGMPLDCPQRNERQPWLGDRSTGSGGEAFVFNNANLYAKWLDDIEQSQTAEGAIPDVAPAFWNYYSDNMTWPGTYLLVADMLYRQFGDTGPVIKHYPSMKKWMDYMKLKYMKNFILTKDKYGDWCVPPESLEIIRSRDSTRTTNGELISSAYYYWLLQYMKRFATLAGKKVDIKIYDELAARIKAAFHKKFYNEQKNYYDNNTVTANLLPLYFGMTPGNLEEAVFNNIYNKITVADQMHISTGVIGTQWLMRGLTQFRKPAIAYQLASSKTYPSWGYMAENGATTIWELWNGNTASPQMNSQNHVMLLGDLLIWLYENAAGIKSTDTAVAFKEVVMKPSFVEGLNEVNASYRSPYGIISSHWKKQNNHLTWEIDIPANSNAIVYIPAGKADDIKEGGNVVNPANLHFLVENGNAVFKLGSGHYSFTVDSFKN